MADSILKAAIKPVEDLFPGDWVQVNWARVGAGLEWVQVAEAPDPTWKVPVSSGFFQVVVVRRAPGVSDYIFPPGTDGKGTALLPPQVRTGKPMSPPAHGWRVLPPETRPAGHPPQYSYRGATPDGDLLEMWVRPSNRRTHWLWLVQCTPWGGPEEPKGEVCLIRGWKQGEFSASAATDAANAAASGRGWLP